MMRKIAIEQAAGAEGIGKAIAQERCAPALGGTTSQPSGRAVDEQATPHGHGLTPLVVTVPGPGVACLRGLISTPFNHIRQSLARVSGKAIHLGLAGSLTPRIVTTACAMRDRNFWLKTENPFA